MMTVRNSWVLPAAGLMLLAVLAIVIFGNSGVEPLPNPQPPPVAILRVPAQFATIQAAVDAARPGDVIQLAAGTYNENIVLDKVVDLVAAHPDPLDPTNNSTILDGDNGQAGIFIASGLKQRPSIEGFVIRNGQVGIEAHSQFVVGDCFFYGSQVAIRYAAGSGGANRGNVYFNSTDDAVHVDDVSLPLLIESNRFLYSGDDAMELDFPQARTLSPVVVDIFNNVVVGSSQDGLKFADAGTGPQDANRHIIVAGNLIANSRRAGVGFVGSTNTNEDFSGAGAAEAVRLYNNTLYGNSYGISGGSNLVAFNNIIALTSSRGAWRVQGQDGSNSVIAYTLFWHNGLDIDQSTEGLGNIHGQDPLFIAGPGPGPDGSWGSMDDDFSGLVPGPGSPAIDRGVSQYTSAGGEQVPASPLTGFTGAAPDLGWKESGSPIAAAGTPSPTRTAGPAVTATAFTPAVGSTSTAAGAASPTAAGSATAANLTESPASPGIPSTGNITPTSTPGSPTPPQLTESPGPNTPQAASETSTGFPAVSIAEVSPSSASRGETLTLTVTGTGFEPGLALSFQGGTGTPPNVIALQILDSTTLIVTTEALNSTSEQQVWDVRVDNPDGSSALLESGFTVEH
jgi:hypothetical protein